jgi:tetratricopeptide (TPR) repeat protein
LREGGRAQDSLNAFERALSEAASARERCRAHIGIAAANRLLSRTEPALAALAAAQPLAEAEDLVLEESQIHYYRGNIFFAQGDATACLGEHQAALAAAERADSNEWRARALSGLGDAHYSACRMGTALSAFEQCVALCYAHGYGRVALPNRIMIGHCLLYQQRTPQALATIEEARRIALQAENPHTAMFATQSLGLVLTHNGRSQEALKYLPDALAQARALAARRYETNVLILLAECALWEGRRGEALALAQDAVALSRELGMGFNGPYALAVLARATDDPALRAAALAEGEAVLRTGSVGHNRVWYYRAAGDVHIEAGSWVEAQQCADTILAATSAEPLPLVEFIAARLKALAAAGRGERGPPLRGKFERLIAQSTANGHDSWLHALKEARDGLGGN